MAGAYCPAGHRALVLRFETSGLGPFLPLHTLTSPPLRIPEYHSPMKGFAPCALLALAAAASAVPLVPTVASLPLPLTSHKRTVPITNDDGTANLDVLDKTLFLIRSCVPFFVPLAGKSTDSITWRAESTRTPSQRIYLIQASLWV